jgi:hypothetical protein
MTLFGSAKERQQRARHSILLVFREHGEVGDHFFNVVISKLYHRPNAAHVDYEVSALRSPACTITAPFSSCSPR